MVGFFQTISFGSAFTGARVSTSIFLACKTVLFVLTQLIELETTKYLFGVIREKFEENE